ncbi:hypothetical protein ABEB36_005790 [Hypothenemus hampei]|uniref:Uncharacterized protein n=1 Tax=Hypothenemus hampei TaxID=57062 RepID=A0ABD1F233_HYPHA
MDDYQALAFIIAYKLLNKRKNRKNRQGRVKKWVNSQNQLGACETTLVQELKLEDAQQFKNFCRISAVQFEMLLSLVGHQIAKWDTRLRNSIPANHRLMVTFRFLTSSK